MTANAYQYTDDDYEQAIEPLPPGAGQAQRDAAASNLLRAMAAAQRELNERDEALAAEIARLRMRYANISEKLKNRYAYLESVVCGLARESDFGKAKSRTVGCGVYGVRQIREKVVVDDDAAALAWAKEHDCIRIKESINKAKLDTALYLGEDVAGCHVEPARDEPFATPEKHL